MKSTLGTRREAGFWKVSCVALFLSILSWVSPILIAGLNIHLFRADSQAAPGQWLYLALRVPLTALLVWTIIGLPSGHERTASKETVRHTNSDSLRRFDPLMGLRALACLFVLMGHFFLVYFPFAGEKYSHGVVALLLHSSPWGGVWVFFTLSGFLMGKGFATRRYSLDGSGMRAFLRNRMIRIAPVYYCGILLITIYRDPVLLHWRNLWMIAELCLFDSRGYPPIQPLWSVDTEMQFYLLVPSLAFLLLGLRTRLGKAFLAFPVLLVMVETALRTWLAHRTGALAGSFVYSPLMTNLDIFVAGMSISMLDVPKVLSQRAKKALSALLAVGAVVLYVGISYLTQHRGQMNMSLEVFWAKGPALCVLPVALFIYLAEMRGKIEIGRGMGSRFLIMVEGMGTLTYCVYVFHSDVFEANAMLLPAVHSLRVSLEQFPLVMLETGAVAWLVYYFIEKPFDMKKKIPGTALMDAP